MECEGTSRSGKGLRPLHLLVMSGLQSLHTQGPLGLSLNVRDLPLFLTPLDGRVSMTLVN